MNEKKWKEVKEFYKVNFDIPPDLVDISSCIDILIMCASGSSNSSIESELNVEIMYIRKIIQSFFSFDGWESNLKFSPLRLYKKMVSGGKSGYMAWCKFCKSLDNEDRPTQKQLEDMFRSCKALESIFIRLNKEWI